MSSGDSRAVSSRIGVRTFCRRSRRVTSKPFKVGIVQGATDSTVTVREYDVDGTTVIDTQTMTASKIIDTADGALYDVGVATGDFGSGTCLITVRQM